MGVLRLRRVAGLVLLTGGLSLVPQLPAQAPGNTPRVAAAQVLATRLLPGSNRWRLTRPAYDGQIEGYPSRVSVLPGQPVDLMVSTGAPSYVVRAWRLGHYIGGTGRMIWRSGRLPGHRQAAPSLDLFETRTIVAGWTPSLTVRTSGWPPGFYMFTLSASTGWQAYVPFVVRSPSAEGRLALVAPVTTWQAYNTWGGYSLYQGPQGDRRSWAVSFDRPYPAPGAGQMMFGVVPVVLRAERLGVPLAYLTNVDVDADPTALDGATGYVSMGHDEYWTPTMRDRVLDARRHGTNLAFLGADTMYWRVRLESGTTGADRLMVGYRTDAALDPDRLTLPAATTTAFRDPPAPYPEEGLTGLQYECYPVDAAYRVVSPRWWGFRGTRVSYGERFEHLVGVEADRVHVTASTPRPLQVLSHVGYDCDGVPTSSESTYYSTPSGAGVFDAGTLRWTCALEGWCRPYRLPARTVRFVRRVTDTVLSEFARGPAGMRHPARDNVASVPPG